MQLIMQINDELRNEFLFYALEQTLFIQKQLPRLSRGFPGPSRLGLRHGKVPCDCIQINFEKVEYSL